MTTAEYPRRWRAKKGAKTGRIGRPITRPCGTPAAYRRHLRHGEAPCGPCKEAWSDYQRMLYQRRKGR